MKTIDNSYWVESTKNPQLPTLKDDLEVDVAVIGGGIAGLTTAYLLKKEGLKVAVLEQASGLAYGVTGHTTGKVTSQHNLCYSKILSDRGRETAKAYGQGNQQAIGQIEKIIRSEKIHCDWQRDDNYVYSEKVEEIDKLKQEAKLAKELGLPASFEKEIPLPFPVAGAVKFANQAKFHARKYSLGLAKAIHGNGSYVFVKSKAKAIKNGVPAIVQTDNGRIRAKDIVIATNVPYPLIAHSLYCFLEYPLSSYIIAAPCKKRLKGMYISTGNPLRSILPIQTKNGQLLLMGGESHIPYTKRVEPRFEKLSQFAKDRFGLSEIQYRWYAFDYLAYDSVPLVGKLYPWTDHIYVTTAYFKWGLTNTTMAAMILRDLLTGQKNPWAKYFDSTRLSPVWAIPKVIGRSIGLVG